MKDNPLLHSSDPKSEIPYVIPLKSRKWTEDYTGKLEKCNYIYYCSVCRTEFTIFARVCPYCLIPIDWDNIQG